MKALINSQEVSVNTLSYNNGLNFNRFLKESKVVNYTIEVDKIRFIKTVEETYNIANSEIKEDDEKYGDESDFKEIGYCSFLELLNKPEKLTTIFDWYLRDAFFTSFLTHKPFDYVINSVDKIEVIEEVIKIHGKAFKAVKI